MTSKNRMIGVAVVSWTLAMTSGCVNPDGTQNNTGTGAIIGGAVGALAGAAMGGRHAGDNALIGAAIGAASGALIGLAIDQNQREQLRQQSPQTLAVVEHNNQLAQQPPQPVAAGQPAPSADAPTPLKVDDIKALTAAGVKSDAIIKAIKESNAPAYSPADIAAAQQANPPVDPSVVAFMQNPAS